MELAGRTPILGGILVEEILVPEPSSLLLLGGCALSSIVWGRKRLRRGGAR